LFLQRTLTTLRKIHLTDGRSVRIFGKREEVLTTAQDR
jgi:hypothetical protein